MENDTETKKTIPFGWLRLSKPKAVKLPNGFWAVDGQPGQYDTKEEAEQAAEKYRR